MDDATCQVVEAPPGGGQRLVPDVTKPSAETGAVSTKPARDTAIRASKPAESDEIRLTYRELSALIEEAIRSLR
jgi:hypothetical protein